MADLTAVRDRDAGRRWSLLTLVAGLWPALLLGITDPAVRVLMKGV